jgi:general secretion pathway protein A
MYYQYFGLKEAPFSIAVNPRYLFMSARHRDALAHLLYGVGAGGGFILLTGEVGTGKTTINRALLEQLPDATDVAIILNPALDALELLASVCDELGVDYDPQGITLKGLTDRLHAFLLDNHTRGRKTVLLIDEAQHLDVEVLEQIRLLTNLETHHEKLLQIVLIGQPELAAKLARPELRQLNQRITARYNLEPLNVGETRAYIRHRLQVAGLTADRELFPGTTVRRIHRHTRGIPRLINVLCDRALLGAYGRDRPRVDRSVLAAAAREVLGSGTGRERRRHWPWAVAAGLLLAGLGGLWWLGMYRAAPEALPVSSAQAAPTRVSPVVPPIPSGAVGPEPASSTTAVDEGGSGDPDHTGRAPWLLPPESAAHRLWNLYTDVPAPRSPCAAAERAGLACHRDRAETWDALQAYQPPLVLQLVTPSRFKAAALVLGLEGEGARLATAGGPVTVPLAQLGPLWNGEFFLLWQPPDGFRGPLALGDEGPAVAQVARMLGQLDGQPEPLAGERFNRALQARVRLFQKANALVPDGVVGVRTLLALNRQLGSGMAGSLAQSPVSRERL